jgi:hypothetical protein
MNSQESSINSGFLSSCHNLPANINCYSHFYRLAFNES